MSGERDKKWEQVQTKAFKSWVNGTLQSKGVAPIDDLVKEIGDGVKLIRFLEILTRIPVGRYDKNPLQRIQKIQNANLALHHMADKLGVKLVGVGAEDIVDGNLKLVLGMLWTLFRATRLGSITGQSGTSTEDALLTWVKQMLVGYEGINITNFKESFNDGLVFSALINKFDPNLLDYKSVLAKRDKSEENIENAFSVAETGLNIPKLLDSADLLSGNVDERSVILYVSLFFHAFVAAEERRKEREAAEAITKRQTNLKDQLELLEEERSDFLRTRSTLNDKITNLEAESLARKKKLEEWNQYLADLEKELEYLRKRALADAEAIRLLEEKNRVLASLLDNESLLKGSAEEARARLLADLEELRKRGKELAGEKEGLDELRRRLITENDKKAQVLADLEARKQALLNEIEQLRKLIQSELDKRRAAMRNALQLQKELEALRRKMINQGKARVGLDVLKRNLEEHIEELYKWRDQNNLSEEDQKRVFDIDKVTADLKDKVWLHQLKYLDENLQLENKTLLRIIKLKDSGLRLRDVEAKSGWLFMKGRKDWKKRWFSLRGFTLFYFETEAGERCEGYVDLNKGCEVVRQKAVKEDDSAKKQWPLKISVGERKLFVRAATKKERHSWYLFLASRIAHLNYLKSIASTPNPVRLDTRLITLFSSDVVTDLHLDHRPIPDEGSLALSKTLPAHDETESLSLTNSSLDDGTLKHLAEVLEKLNFKSLNLSRNHISGLGAEDLAKGIATNISLTALNLQDNNVDDHGLAALAANIATKPLLTSLNLNGNAISVEGVKSLAEHLANPNHSFPEILLARNKLGDDGAVEVAKLIVGNPTVTSVNLAGNNIGNRGASALAKSLAASGNVTHLDLSNNNIGADAIPDLEKLLTLNNLTHINLSGNKNLSGPAVSNLFKKGFNYPELSYTRIEL